MIKQSISKNGFMLAIFALVTTACIVITSTLTRDRIETNKQKALEKALFELVPKNTHDNNILDDYVLLEKGVLSNKKSKAAYFAFKNSKPLAVILPATAPDGYGGAIQLIVGINFNGSIAGVRVVPPHNETPGLGDAIEVKKSDWILGFNKTSLERPSNEKWKVKKDGGHFDQMTGATITPRAIVKAVHKSLIYFENNKQSLLNKVMLKKNLEPNLNINTNEGNDA